MADTQDTPDAPSEAHSEAHAAPEAHAEAHVPPADHAVAEAPGKDHPPPDGPKREPSQDDNEKKDAGPESGGGDSAAKQEQPSAAKAESTHAEAPPQKQKKGKQKQRETTESTGPNMSAVSKKVCYQNSYHLEPVVKFNSDRALGIIKASLHSKFEDTTQKYAVEMYPELCKVLTEEIKERVKDLRVDRYKIVCVTYVGQKVDNSLMIASRSLWYPSVDTYACYTYENVELFVTSIVYALCNE